MKKTNIYEDRDSLGMAAANLFVRLSAEAIARKGKCIVALSGGSTPDAMYLYLSSKEYTSVIEWEKIYFFWSDERYVDFNDEENNSLRAINNFLSLIRMDASRVFRVNVELPVEEAAVEYEQTLRQIAGNEMEVDICFLGMGDDGHIASIFPDSPLLGEDEKGVRSVYVETLNRYRISFTLPLINAAQNIVLLVSGSDKSAAYDAIQDEEATIEQFPVIGLNSPAGHSLYWMITSDVQEEA